MERPVFPVVDDVGRRRLQEVSGRFTGHLDQLFRGVGHCRAGNLHGAGPARCVPGGDGLGVAVEYLDGVQRQA